MTKLAVQGVLARFSLPKKWWQPLDGTTDIASAVLSAANRWTPRLSVTALMTRYIVGSATDVYGIHDFLTYLIFF